MALSAYERLPKQELARSQLEVALRFYMQGQEYPAVITLAGAAEEVLGKIAESKGFEPALKRTLRELCETFKEVWGHEAKESDFAQLRNRARNELKHLGSGDNLHLDFEREAAAMLTRALENYVLCTGSPHPGQYAFTSKKVANWRSKQGAV
ncbi:hypothetical protein FHT03_000251 [Xanthomonas arboricola]|uniref:hypothetical protein n=1 Tax=Xanthomonas cannabis TaxID=1885674 RepID=UPI001622069F|nr:hypothetical protein [Xanthomonas cannabis]MBB3804745.1 hypothetical protein [Xanthomonas cannabis]